MKFGGVEFFWQMWVCLVVAIIGIYLLGSIETVYGTNTVTIPTSNIVKVLSGMVLLTGGLFGALVWHPIVEDNRVKPF